MTTKSDFLAIILIASGSSHARGPDKEDCISRVQRIFVDDWSSLFDVSGKEATIGVYDVTGFDEVYWDHRGVHSGDKTFEPIELRKVTLPKKRR